MLINVLGTDDVAANIHDIRNRDIRDKILTEEDVVERGGIASIAVVVSQFGTNRGQAGHIKDRLIGGVLAIHVGKARSKIAPPASATRDGPSMRDGRRRGSQRFSQWGRASGLMVASLSACVLGYDISCSCFTVSLRGNRIRGCLDGRTLQSLDCTVACTVRVTVVARPSIRVVLFRKAFFNVPPVGHGPGIQVKFAMEAVVLVVAFGPHT